MLFNSGDSKLPQSRCWPQNSLAQAAQVLICVCSGCVCVCVCVSVCACACVWHLPPALRVTGASALWRALRILRTPAHECRTCTLHRHVLVRALLHGVLCVRACYRWLNLMRPQSAPAAAGFGFHTEIDNKSSVAANLSCPLLSTQPEAACKSLSTDAHLGSYPCRTPATTWSLMGGAPTMMKPGGL